jgi:hypothetical protein
MQDHLRLFVFVTIAWILFWVVGLPDYYQQYSWESMIVFDLVILPPIWLIIYHMKGRNEKNMRILWI